MALTAGSMRNLILVAMILHLAITVDFDINGKEMKFGDIISFPTTCEGPVVLKHFAVYVGDREIPGKLPGQNIFHRLKSPSLQPTCIFNTLYENDEPEVNNYLDGYKDGEGKEYKKDTDEKIEERIKERHGNCQQYLVLHNNCEHLATYVRYGEKVSLQFNMTGQSFCISHKSKMMVEYVKSTTSCPRPPIGHGS